jgi:hypothetical protein
VKIVLCGVTSKWANCERKGFSRADLTTILQQHGRLSHDELENLGDAISNFMAFVIATPDAFKLLPLDRPAVHETQSNSVAEACMRLVVPAPITRAIANR